MYTDARTVAPGTCVEAETCIIGAGPAGLTAAMELARLGRQVLLIDAGGFGPDTVRDDLSAPAAGFAYGTERILINRQQFGGNANAWHVRAPGQANLVRFASYRPADFEPRSDLSDSDWPFRADDLAADAARAAAIWNTPQEGFEAPQVPDPSKPVLAAGPDVDTAYYQFPPASIATQTIRERLAAYPNVRILLNGVVTRLNFEGGRIKLADVASNPGRTFTVSARTFVLAAGALNACKLLFASPMPAGHAPGNQGDALGRYLMDHPGVHGGVFYPADPALFDRMAAYDLHTRGEAVSMGHACLSDARLREGGVLALASHFFPRDRYWRWDHVPSFRQNDAGLAAIAIRRDLDRGAWPKPVHLRNLVLGLDAVSLHFVRRALAPVSSMGRGGWSGRPGASRRYSVFEIIQSAEQAPHRDNRIFQSDEKDALGQNRIGLDWRLHEADEQKIVAAQKVFEAAIASSGLGRIDHARPDGALRIVTTSSHHHIGGLRMGTDPRTSVTDAEARVQGTDNLYVAGAGLFPTGSYANPTWLITVLSARLARQLSNAA